MSAHSWRYKHYITYGLKDAGLPLLTVGSVPVLYLQAGIKYSADSISETTSHIQIKFGISGLQLKLSVDSDCGQYRSSLRLVSC
jgi:hypothetical protein